jgi:twitching motility protein PilT
MDIKKFLKIMLEKDASDIFIKIGYSPYLRIWGEVVSIDSSEVISEQDMQSILKSILTPAQMETFNKSKELDFMIDFPELGRFRGSLFLDRQLPGLVFRHIKKKVPTFADLNLPTKILQKLSFESRGLVLLTGTVGNGKSTTIASMIEYINQNKNKHILTIEDPVEYLFENKKSVITQRDVGYDTDSYLEALRHSVYQSTDVVYIGTIRDAETAGISLTAAESGQLVLATLHAINASQTIERIVNLFPAHLHEEIRMRLSLFLKGVISQRLVPRIDGKGRIPVVEIMVLTPTIASAIREGETHQLPKIIEDGAFFGMQSFPQALARLYLNKKISLETAKKFSDNPKEVELFIQGIKKLDSRDLDALIKV